MGAVNWRRAAWTSAVYVGAAIALTWPLTLQLTSRLGATHGPGDPFLNLWILGWGLQAWTGDPSSIVDGRVFDANIFYPAEGTLAYSDHFLLQALALAPLYALSGDVVLCYNVLLIASIALSGMAMHALVRSLTASTAGALAAGLAWACWPYRTAHLVHIQLQALYFLPLALLFLHRVVAGRRWRDALALGAFVALQAAASVYYGVMTVVVIVPGAIALALATGQWRARRLWTRLAGAGLLAVALASPLLVPYLRSQQAEGFGRTVFEASNHSATWRSFVQVPPQNLLYGRSGALAERGDPAHRARGHEHQLFPGIVIVVLGIIGALRYARRDLRPLVITGVVLIAAGVTLSLGPGGARPLYVFLHDHVFGFQAVRAPARFAVVAFLGACLLAALGMKSVGTRSKPVAAAIIALMMLEYLNAPWILAAAPPRRTAVGQWLALEPAAGAVLHLPLADDVENTTAMVQSLEHRRRIVNGYSGQRPPFFSALVEGLADFPSPVSLAMTRELDVRFVVSSRVLAGAGNPRSPLVERARFEEGIVYELRWTGDAVAALGDASGPPPPAPGPIPFTLGEAATYDVFWESGPVDIPAGTATLSVTHGTSDAWTFEVVAETASWMDTFFRAHDRFVTRTDRMLLPIEHRRDIDEGRRQLTRVYLYRRDERQVRVGDSIADAESAEALTLALGHEASRDAVAALYYVRTLPLTPGSIVSIPLNEAGSNLTLQVSTAERETIDRQGQRVAAWRLEPRLMRRIERRRAIAMTIWVSDDPKRVPLRAIVDAGFGRVRAELRAYRD